MRIVQLPASDEEGDSGSAPEFAFESMGVLSQRMRINETRHGKDYDLTGVSAGRRARDEPAEWRLLRERLGISHWPDSKLTPQRNAAGKLSLDSLMGDTETQWYRAIGQWEIDNERSPLLRLLKQDQLIPAFARQWLANALLGSIKRKRGRPRSPISLAEMMATWQRHQEVKQEFHRRLVMARVRADGKHGAIEGTPTEQALQATGERFSMTADAVSHIVNPRKARNSRK